MKKERNFGPNIININSPCIDCGSSNFYECRNINDKICCFCYNTKYFNLTDDEITIKRIIE